MGKSPNDAEETLDGGRPTRVDPPSDLTSLLSVVTLPPEDRLAVDGRLAAGGMGTIEKVVDLPLDRKVARKVIHSNLSTDSDIVRRFVREARITGRLDHPNIVPIHDVGLDSEGRLFFTMKLVTGENLEAIVRKLPDGALPTETLYELLDAVTRVCDALALAHVRGVLHCDVKPANVMVGAFGQVYLMDWGIARVLGEDEETDAEAVDAQRMKGDGTQTEDAVLGSPAFMSPEQAWGKRSELSVVTDVYAVGALIYFFLSRRPPHGAKSVVAALYNAQHEDPPALPDDVPPELARIVTRALSRAPEARHPSVLALKQDILRFMRGGAEFPTREYAAGETIVTEGEVGDAAYIIVSGQCDALRLVHGQRRVLRTMGPGEVFGETAILSEGPRTATVIAREDSLVQVVDRKTVEQELGALKPWMGALLSGLADRFRDLEQQRD